MPKVLLRIVCCLLVPCLIADPTLAAAIRPDPFLSGHYRGAPFLDPFAAQALTPVSTQANIPIERAGKLKAFEIEHPHSVEDAARVPAAHKSNSIFIDSRKPTVSINELNKLKAFEDARDIIRNTGNELRKSLKILETSRTGSRQALIKLIAEQLEEYDQALEDSKVEAAKHPDDPNTVIWLSSAVLDLEKWSTGVRAALGIPALESKESKISRAKKIAQAVVILAILSLVPSLSAQTLQSTPGYEGFTSALGHSVNIVPDIGYGIFAILVFLGVVYPLMHSWFSGTRSRTYSSQRQDAAWGSNFKMIAILAVGGALTYLFYAVAFGAVAQADFDQVAQVAKGPGIFMGWNIAAFIGAIFSRLGRPSQPPVSEGSLTDALEKFNGRLLGLASLNQVELQKMALTLANQFREVLARIRSQSATMDQRPSLEDLEPAALYYLESALKSSPQFARILNPDLSKTFKDYAPVHPIAAPTDSPKLDVPALQVLALRFAEDALVKQTLAELVAELSKDKPNPMRVNELAIRFKSIVENFISGFNDYSASPEKKEIYRALRHWMGSNLPPVFNPNRKEAFLAAQELQMDLATLRSLPKALIFNQGILDIYRMRKSSPAQSGDQAPHVLLEKSA